MILRPPRSTLFPTRRSSDLVAGRRGTRHHDPGAPPGHPRHARRDAPGDQTHDGTRGRVAHPRPGEGDRKSTRLNSSHITISYAVFCLKKKKKQKHTENNEAN